MGEHVWLRVSEQLTPPWAQAASGLLGPGGLPHSPATGLLSAPLWGGGSRWVWVCSCSRRHVCCSFISSLPCPPRCLRSWVSDVDEAAAAAGWIQLTSCNTTLFQRRSDTENVWKMQQTIFSLNKHMPQTLDSFKCSSPCLLGQKMFCQFSWIKLGLPGKWKRTNLSSFFGNLPLPPRATFCSSSKTSAVELGQL